MLAFFFHVIMVHVCFNIGYGYFPPKGIVLSSGGPTCLPRGMILIQALKLTSYSSPHFQDGGNRFPRKRQKARDLCLCHSFLPFLSRATGSLLEQILSEKFSIRPSMQGGYMRSLLLRVWAKRPRASCAR